MSANTNGMSFPMTALGAVEYEGIQYAEQAGQVFDARRKEMVEKLRAEKLAVPGDTGNIGHDIKAAGSTGPIADVPRETIRAPGYPETGRPDVIHTPRNPETLPDDNPIAVTPNGSARNEASPRDESVGAHVDVAGQLHAQDEQRAESEQTGELPVNPETQNPDGSVKNTTVDKTEADQKTKGQGAGTETKAAQDAKAGTKTEGTTASVRRTRS